MFSLYVYTTLCYASWQITSGIRRARTNNYKKINWFLIHALEVRRKEIVHHSVQVKIACLNTWSTSVPCQEENIVIQSHCLSQHVSRFHSTGRTLLVFITCEIWKYRPNATMRQRWQKSCCTWDTRHTNTSIPLNCRYLSLWRHWQLFKGILQAWGVNARRWREVTSSYPNYTQSTVHGDRYNQIWTKHHINQRSRKPTIMVGKSRYTGLLFPALYCIVSDQNSTTCQNSPIKYDKNGIADPCLLKLLA